MLASRWGFVVVVAVALTALSCDRRAEELEWWERFLVDHTPAWTADGESMVVRDHGQRRLYLASTQGDAVRWVTSAPWWQVNKPKRREYSYAVSGDGALAFQSLQEGYGHEHQVVLRQLEPGLTSTLLAETPMAWSHNSEFAWSPDGTMLAYYSLETGMLIADAWGRELHRYFLPSAPGELSPQDAYMPLDVEWSPDGNNLVVVARNPDGDWWRIIVMSVDGADWVNVMEVRNKDSSVGLSAPDWSPDGERIYFAHYIEANGYGQTAIYEVRPDGAGLRQLGSLPGQTFIGDVKVSPDGNTLLLISRLHDQQGRHFLMRPGPGGLYLMGTDGSGDLRQVREGDLWASWSPDGERIAVHDPLYHANLDALYTLHADGSPGQVLVRRDADGKPEPAHGRQVAHWEPDTSHRAR